MKRKTSSKQEDEEHRPWEMGTIIMKKKKRSKIRKKRRNNGEISNKAINSNQDQKHRRRVQDIGESDEERRESRGDASKTPPRHGHPSLHPFEDRRTKKNRIETAREECQEV